MKTKIAVTLTFIFSFMSCEIADETNSQNHQMHDDVEVISTETIRPYEPDIVGPGIISTAAFEGHASLTPDGNTIFYTIYTNDHRFSTITFSEKVDGRWQTPRIADFSGRYHDAATCFSPDGKKLYFSSNRPLNDADQPKTDDGVSLFYQKIGESPSTVIIPNALYLFEDFKKANGQKK